MSHNTNTWEKRFTVRRAIALAAATLTALACVGCNPEGAFDPTSVVWHVDGPVVSVSGVAFDRDAAAQPVAVYITEGGTIVATVTTDTQRRFAALVNVPVGETQVCARVANVAGTPGEDVTLSCQKLTVSGRTFGHIDSVTPANDGVYVTGWAIEPQNPGSVDVTVQTSGGQTTVTANEPKPGLDRYVGYGPNHGFSAKVPYGNLACAYGLGAAPGQLDCVDVALVGRDEVNDLVNAVRVFLGVPAVARCASLEQAADDFAAAMAKSGQFSHQADGQSLKDRLWRYANGTSIGAGENLARGQRTASEAVVGWMTSDAHRQNLLNPAWTHVGYGKAYSTARGQAEFVWVQEFGVGGTC